MKITYAGTLKTPKTLKAIAAITDLNHQTRETSTNFILHPSLYYIGVNVKRSYGKPKDVFPMEVVVTDIDGRVKENVAFWIKQTRSWVQDEKGKRGSETYLSLLTSFRRTRLDEGSSKDKHANHQTAVQERAARLRIRPEGRWSILF